MIARLRPTRVSYAAKPLVWGLALGWLILRAVGHGVARFHDWYDRGFSTLGRACSRLAIAILRSLGPLGRGLWRIAVPVLRILRRAWAWLGLRVFLLLVRPMNRLRQWLVDRLNPVVNRVIRCSRWVAARVAPMMRMLEACARTVERAAERLLLLLRRAWAPAARSVRAVITRWSENGH